MLKTTLYRNPYSAAFVMLLCLLLALVPLEASVNEQLTSMLKVTLTVYALARSLNAVLSVVQETELSIEPMGVGVTLAPGQILDPLNDLIEQFSTVLLMASASLGIQKILLPLGDIPWFRWSLVVLAAAALLIALWPKKPVRWQSRFFNLLLILTLLRLAIPLTVLTANQLQLWLEQDRQDAIAVLQTTQQQVAAIQPDMETTERSWYQGITDNLDIKAKLRSIEQRVEEAINAAIYLLAEFVLTMLLIPIGFLFIAWRLIGTIIGGRSVN